MPIQVGKAEITDHEIFAEMQYQGAAKSLQEACFLAAQSLVIRQLLLDAALKQQQAADKAKGEKSINPEIEEKLIDNLISKEVHVPKADTAACKRYYENNKAKFKDKSTDKILPFDQVTEHIAEYLGTQSLLRGVSEYIEVLAANTKITGFDFKDPEKIAVDMKSFTKNAN